jgi:serine/threonine protein kinase/tetratricopeptide (TPR) repeat protein
MSERVGEPAPGSAIGTEGAVATPAVVDTADLASAKTLPASSVRAAISPNQQVARFSITELLGSGGMGQVFAARDPELDRLVAIKLLRPELSTLADARLRREARAMARLSHPHLVTVHEVGVHEGQLFIAMELIDGQTLRQWSRGKSWRDIVRVYIAAGRGLAAAHEAGVVHRDFKPDNVLVGDDGRVAVSDFGLAQTEAPSPNEDHAKPSGDDNLTQAGTLLGTLRYMAPEQLERRGADARSDQFAFCVSLWEALDAHPFDGTRSLPHDAATRLEAMTAAHARLKLPGVPRRIGRALVRGLALDPTARWPEMPALLAQLDAAVARRAKIVLAALVLGLIAIAISATWQLRTPATDPCSNVAEEVARVWRPGDGSKLLAAFATTGRPNASDSANRVAQLLDRRAAEWGTMRIGTCVAIKSDGRGREDLHVRQLSCLAAQLRELEAVVSTLMTKPTGETVDRSIRATLKLAPVADCANVAALLDQPVPPQDPAIEIRIDHLAVAIAKAKARDTLVGDLTQVTDLEREAAALHWDPLVAETAFLAGGIMYRRGDAAAAETKLRDAALAAARAHEDVIVGMALALATRAVVDGGRPHEALEIARAAELASARAGDPPLVHAEVKSALGDAYMALSKFDDSDRAYAKAVEILETSRASPHELARVMNSWANQLYERSDYARGVPLSNKAVATMRAVVGDHHPDLARVLHSNGNQQTEIHDYALARSRFEEALAIKESIFGSSDPTVAMTLHSLGNVYKDTDDYARASELYERALGIWLAKSGPANQNVLMARYSIAVNLKHQGKFAESLAQLEDVLSRRLANPNTTPVKIANTLHAIANAHTDLGDRAKAIEYESRALAIREKVLGPETSDVADSLGSLAASWAAGGDCVKARPAASRALAILRKQPSGDVGVIKASPLASLASCNARDGKLAEAIAGYREAIALVSSDRDARGEFELSLAELLWSTDRSGARALALSATQGHGSWAPRAKAWLASHPAP